MSLAPSSVHIIAHQLRTSNNPCSNTSKEPNTLVMNQPYLRSWTRNQLIETHFIRDRKHIKYWSLIKSLNSWPKQKSKFQGCKIKSFPLRLMTSGGIQRWQELGEKQEQLTDTATIITNDQQHEFTLVAVSPVRLKRKYSFLI